MGKRRNKPPHSGPMLSPSVFPGFEKRKILETTARSPDLSLRWTDINSLSVWANPGDGSVDTVEDAVGATVEFDVGD